MHNETTLVVRDQVSNTATHCNIPQHTASYYNTLQHNVTHCNTKMHNETTPVVRGQFLFFFGVRVCPSNIVGVIYGVNEP